MDEITWSRQKWWVQRAYAEGMSEDEEIPFTFLIGDYTLSGDPDPVDASPAELAELGIAVIHRG